MKIVSATVLYSTPFLELIMVNYVDHNKDEMVWYGVRRIDEIPAVAIAALTADNELIVVRQNRPLLGGKTIELPAGLMDKKGETVVETARRELLEETGYTGESFELLVGGAKGLSVTAGLTNERLFLVLAKNVVKVAEPLANEGTEPILVPLSESYDWLTAQVAAGADVDYKMFGTVRMIEKEA